MNENQHKGPTSGVELIARQIQARAGVREEWRAHAGSLLDAHFFAVTALATYAFQTEGIRFENTNASINGRLSLVALFFHAIDLCEVAIAEGLYSQASTLLRQKMEIIEAIHQHETSRRSDRAPKLSKLKDEFGRFYGELSASAHVCKDDLNHLMVAISEGDARGPSIVPFFNKDLAERLYTLDITLMALFFQQFETLNREVGAPSVGEEEAGYMMTALKVLADRELITFPQKD